MKYTSHDKRRYYEERSTDPNITEGQRRWAKNVARGIAAKQRDIDSHTSQSYLDRIVKDNKTLIDYNQETVNEYIAREKNGERGWKSSREEYQDKVAYHKGAQIVIDEEVNRRNKKRWRP